jgi:hypothetical protein
MTISKSLKTKISSIKKEDALWMIVIMLIIALVLMAWTTVRTLNEHAAELSKLSLANESSKEKEMQQFVNKVEERRYRYPVVDIKENRMYIPETRMYVPLNDDSRDLRYQTLGDTIWLSTSMAVGRQTGNDDASCDRVVLIVPSEDRGKGYTPEGIIKASDGSTRYIFRHPACKIYGDEFSKRLAEVAKLIKTY